MKIFKDDEDGYERWLESHPNGYVLNTGTTRGSGDVTLHRARCGLIAPRPNLRWTHDYIKVCSTDESEVTGWACRKRDEELKKCEKCW